MKKEVNKSQAIRDLQKKNPQLSISDIVAQLGKSGIVVTPSHVYQALKRVPGSKQKSKGKKRGPKPGPRAAKVSSGVPQDLLASMQQFVSSAGSVDRAIEILSVFK